MKNKTFIPSTHHPSRRSKYDFTRSYCNSVCVNDDNEASGFVCVAYRIRCTCNNCWRYLIKKNSMRIKIIITFVTKNIHSTRKHLQFTFILLSSHDISSFGNQINDYYSLSFLFICSFYLFKHKFCSFFFRTLHRKKFTYCSKWTPWRSYYMNFIWIVIYSC